MKTIRTRTLVILLAVVMVCTLAGVAWLTRASALSWLAVRQLSRGDVAEREAAARRLGRLGQPASIPPLVGVLVDEALAVRRAAVDALAAIESKAGPIAERLQELVAQEPDPVELVRTLSIAELPAAPLLDALLERLSVVRARRISNGLPPALARCGLAAVPRLREALATDDQNVRENALQTLALLGAAAAEVVPDIVATLPTAPDELYVGYAARALEKIGPLGWRDEDVAMVASVHEDLGPRGRSIIGAAGDKALPVLLDWLRGEDVERQLDALRMMTASLGGATEGVLAELPRLLRSDTPDVVESACVVVRKIGGSSPEVIEELRALAGCPRTFVRIDGDREAPPEIRRAAADALLRVDLRRSVPFACIFPSLTYAGVSDDPSWAWLRRYREDMPTPEEFAKALADPWQYATARAILKRRPDIARAPVVREALERHPSGAFSSPLFELDRLHQLRGEERRAAIDKALASLDDDGGRSHWSEDRSVVEQLEELEAIDELERIYPKLQALDAQAAAIQYLLSKGRMPADGFTILSEALDAPTARQPIVSSGWDRHAPLVPDFFARICDALRDLGPRAKPTVPALEDRAIDIDPRLRLHATTALVSIEGERWRPAALAALREVLRARSPEQPSTVRWALEYIGASAVSATESLLEDPHECVRASAIANLAAARVNTASTRRRLLRCLEDSDVRVRQAAASALAKLSIGEADVRQLVGLLRDANQDTCRPLGDVLRSLSDGNAALAEECIVEQLPQEPREVARLISLLSGLAALERAPRFATLQAISGWLADPGAAGDAAQRVFVHASGDVALPLLLEQLRSPSDTARRRAFAVLRLSVSEAFAAGSSELRAGVRQALADPVPRVRVAAAATALALRLDLDCDAVLSEAIRAAEPEVVAEAARVAGRGTCGAEVYSALDDLVGSERPVTLRVEALRALGAAARHGSRLPVPSGVELPGLESALDSDEPRLRLEAARALVDVRPRRTFVVQALLRNAGSDPVLDVRRASVRALGRVFGPGTASAKSHLLEALLRDVDPAVREHAALALGRLAQESDTFAPEDVERLAGGLKDVSRRVRAATAEALRALGDRVDPALPAIFDGLAGRNSPAIALMEILTARGAAIVDELINALDRDSTSLRSVVFDTLGRIGPPAKKALPRMRRFLTEGNTRYGGLEENIRRVEGQDGASEGGQ